MLPGCFPLHCVLQSLSRLHMSPTDEKTHSYRIFACFSYIFLDPGLLFLLAGELFALLSSGSVLCTTDVTPRTDFSRSLPHFPFWHQVFGLPRLGHFTPVTHISYSSAAVIKHHDEKYLMGESVFQVTVPGGKACNGRGAWHRALRQVQKAQRSCISLKWEAEGELEAE